MIIRMIKMVPYQMIEITLNKVIRVISTILAICISCSISVYAQGFSAQGISAADLSALKNGAGIQGAATGGLGGTNLPGLLAITVPSMGVQDDLEPLQDDKKAKKAYPFASK